MATRTEIVIDFVRQLPTGTLICSRDLAESEILKGSAFERIYDYPTRKNCSNKALRQCLALGLVEYDGEPKEYTQYHYRRV